MESTADCGRISRASVQCRYSIGSRQRWEQLSALLPHVVAGLMLMFPKANLSEVGFPLGSRSNVPYGGGPFSILTRA